MERVKLVEGAKRGDHAAFSQLAAADIGRLYRIALLMVGGTEPARDAVQDALVEAWRGLPRLRDPSKYDAWLHRLLIRSCYRQRSGRTLQATQLDPGGAPDQNLTSLVDRDELDRGFARLPADQRAVLVLRFYLDLPVADVAATLGLPEGTVKSRLHRGLKTLRAALEADARQPTRLLEGSIR